MESQSNSRQAPSVEFGPPGVEFGRRVEHVKNMAKFPTARELTILTSVILFSIIAFWTGVFYINDAIMRQRDEGWRDYSDRYDLPAGSEVLGKNSTYPFVGTNPQSNLPLQQYRVLFAFFLLATLVQAGLGLEILVWVMFLRHGWPKFFDKAWIFSQFAFPTLTISAVGAAVNRDFMAMIFVVLGLWRFGLPHTFLYFQSAIFNAQSRTSSGRFADLLAGCSLTVHHTAVCFFMSCLLAGVWERTPYIASTFPLFMIQYVLTVVRDGMDNFIVTLLLLGTEFMLEWTIFSTFQVNAMTHWTVVQMYNCVIAAHWMYGLSQIVEYFAEKREHTRNDTLRGLPNESSGDEGSRLYDEDAKRSFPTSSVKIDPNSLGGRVESAKKGLSFPKRKQLWVLFLTALTCVSAVLGGLFFFIDTLMSRRDPDWRDYSDVLIPPGYDPPSIPLVQAYFAALQTEEGYDFAGSSPLLNLNIQQFQGLLAAILLGTTIISGFGLELLVWVIFLQDGWSQDFEKMWKFSNFVFPLLVTMAIGMSTQRDFSYGVILVFGLWKGGMPETFMYMYSAIYNHSKRDTVGRVADMLNGCGTAIHHTSVALFAAAYATGLVSDSPESIHCAIGPLMQHWFAFLHDVSPISYFAIVLAIEVWWEWVIFSSFYYVATVHWSFALIALSMLVAHWLYLAAAAIEIVAHMTLQKVGENPVTRTERNDKEKRSSRRTKQERDPQIDPHLKDTTEQTFQDRRSRATTDLEQPRIPLKNDKNLSHLIESLKEIDRQQLMTILNHPGIRERSTFSEEAQC